MRFSEGTRLERMARCVPLTVLASATGGGGGWVLLAGELAGGWELAWMALPSAPLALATLMSLVLRLELGLAGLALALASSPLAPSW